MLWAPIVAGALTLSSLSVSVSGSGLSTTLSPHSWTVNVRLVSPGLKVSDPSTIRR